LQRKYQTQLQAIKRGGSQSVGPSFPLVDPSSASASSPVEHATTNSQVASQLLEENQLLNDKILMLETELLETAEELGRLKALLSTLSPVSHPSDLPSPPAPLPISEDFMKRIHQLETEIEKLQQQQAAQTLPPVPVPVTLYSEENLLREIDHLRSDLKETLSQQERYSERMREMEKDREGILLNKEELEAEILSLKDELRRPQTPKMRQFLLMEQRLSELEGRLSRRESELLKLLEQSKISANMERMRLQSIHEQVTTRLLLFLLFTRPSFFPSSSQMIRSSERRTNSCCNSKEIWSN
jgi:hypothetical protein